MVGCVGRPIGICDHRTRDQHIRKKGGAQDSRSFANDSTHGQHYVAQGHVCSIFPSQVACFGARASAMAFAQRCYFSSSKGTINSTVCDTMLRFDPTWVNRQMENTRRLQQSVTTLFPTSQNGSLDDKDRDIGKTNASSCMWLLAKADGSYDAPA